MRLLRPLRSLSHMPGMSVLVGSIMKSLAPLANVVFFCMSIFFVFSILCLQLWSDLEYPECGRLLCDEHRGVVKFDNIGWTFITIFQCMTLEGWTDIMYATDDAWDGPAWVVFFANTFFVGLFAVNIALAVITDAVKQAAFIEKKQLEERRQRREREIKAKVVRRIQGNLEQRREEKKKGWGTAIKGTLYDRLKTKIVTERFKIMLKAPKYVRQGRNKLEQYYFNFMARQTPSSVVQFLPAPQHLLELASGTRMRRVNLPRGKNMRFRNEAWKSIPNLC